MRPLIWSEIATLVLISTVLAPPALAQSQAGDALSERPIENPVWLTRPPIAELPNPVSGPIHLNVPLRCQVADGVLAACVAAEPVPEAFVSSAIRAASAARVAALDADGQATEGREITVQIGFPIPVAIDPPPAPPSLSVLTGLIWLEQPDGHDFLRLYPSRAQREHVEGRVTLDCLVNAGGRLSCTVVSEEPREYGFGEATLQISREFRLAPQTRDGVPTAGGRVRRTIRWVLIDEVRTTP